MTDAQAALAQVREAIAAGPRPGEWRVSKYRDGRQALIYDADDFEVARVCYPNRDADAALIAACSPANIAAILAHVETQAAENERLTAALRAQPGPVSMDDVEWAGKAHLADCEARNQKLHAACTALAALVQRDRVALYEAHHYPHSGEIDDEGREALAEYDAALALADQAMGVEGTERNDV